MKVLVTGSAGFLGCELVDYLRKENFSVIELDNNLYDSDRSKKECGDFRDYTFTDSNIDAIIHLAGVSTNYDPPEKYYQDMAMSMNHEETTKFAQKAKLAGIKKFIFASSASVYGNSENTVNENSEAKPLTSYAKSKLLAERGLLSMKSGNFHPIMLRMVTLFGLSRRMRFDVLVNNLISSAIINSKVILNSDGSAIRPQLHVKDACKVYKKILESDPSNFSGEIINVGRDDYNLTVLEIAKIIAKYRNCELVVGKKDSHDSRSYKVEFEKLKKLFNEISFDYGIEYATDEIHKYLKDKKESKDFLEDPYFYNLKGIKHLIENNIVDKDLRYQK